MDNEVGKLVEWAARKIPKACADRQPSCKYYEYSKCEKYDLVDCRYQREIARQILSHPDLAIIVECERCAGRGVFHSEGCEYGEDKPITCSQCHGTGIVPIPLAEALKEAKK